MLLARHNYELAAIADVLEAVSTARSLEIGCGFGRLTPAWAAQSRHHVGIDINIEALADARLAYPEAQFVQGSADALPFASASFGLVAAWTVLQHIPPAAVDAAAAEIARVVDADGIVVLCDVTDGEQHDFYWPRSVDYYRRALSPLQLAQESAVEGIDGLPVASPGRLMVFRAAASSAA